MSRDHVTHGQFHFVYMRYASMTPSHAGSMKQVSAGLYYTMLTFGVDIMV